MPYNRINAIVGGKEKVVTSVDVYKEIRRLQLEGVTSNGQRQSGSVFPAIPSRSIGREMLSHGIGRNTAEKLLL